jgi:uncharacterized protein
MIGAALVRAAQANRMQALRLVRHEPANSGEVAWDPQAAEPVRNLASLEGLDAVIHLSGANLAAHRWTPAYKREILDSRVVTTRALVNVFGALKQPPRVFLCASATGIYGDRGDRVLDEDAPAGEGFIARTCVAWEDAAARASAIGIRVVNLRFGVVLSGEAEGGAFKKMLPIFRFGLGGRLGSGRQWMSWIALSDVMRAVFHILDSGEMSGPVNLVAPNPVANAEFTHVLGRVLHRPALIPAPAFALRLAFGEMADEALLASTRVLPARLLQAGFQFEHPDIGEAVSAILQG